MPNTNATLSLAVVGAGPVGLSLALHAARALPEARITLFDARAADQDVAGDPRTIALSLGSVQLLQRIDAWRADAAQSIVEVHVSQQPPSLGGMLSAWLGEPEVRIRAIDEAVPMLGAVLSYGAIVAPLQAVWLSACEREPQRLASRFGVPVAALKPLVNGVEVDAGIAERFDLAVIAEGGVFSDQVRKAVMHDYRQTAWVGTVTLQDARPGVAYERFTRHGPVALLPLKSGQAALVWCVKRDDDPVAELDDTQRLAVLNTLLHPEAGRVVAMSPLKSFALGLNAERTLTDGRTVRIGNAAQTLHPVAGQGLNLGMRDAFELVLALVHSADVDTVLRRLEWKRAPDRWTMIAATDFLARSFTWQLPGAGAARGLGMAALQALSPIKSALARRMMYGAR
ncbi:MAG: 2-octaprenyl-6-methoxyphenyl hydroxylase [Betaproteobacteria bacterium]|nr:MAG: 2-octaprenyl-6-methoxyphenyl hydroxylase [Betaproteobacteria bacterium]